MTDQEYAEHQEMRRVIAQRAADRAARKMRGGVPKIQPPPQPSVPPPPPVPPPPQPRADQRLDYRRQIERLSAKVLLDPSDREQQWALRALCKAAETDRQLRDLEVLEERLAAFEKQFGEIVGGAAAKTAEIDSLPILQ